MRKQSFGVIAGAAALALLAAGCGGSSSSSTSSGATSSSGASPSAAAASGKVGVILPDASTSPRWETADRPFLDAAFKSAGIGADIQNANKDKSKFGTICDGMINAGVNVLLIVNLDSESGSACLKKAQAAGIKTIDYDRLTLGGGASYYVSFDNVQVGKLMGDGLQKCLTAAGKKTANVVLINGDPTDNNAALFKQGYVASLKTNAGIKIVGDQTGKWDATIAGTAFEQIYTQNNGKVDGVVSANDTMAGGIIARLKAAKVNGKIPVTGQDASVAGLQAILAGDQCMTVYKAVKTEADAAAKLAIALIQNTDATSIVTGTVKDTVLNKDVPSALETPVAIYKDTVKTVIDDGYQKAADVCTAAYAAACKAAGIA
jgi:D-xylose transport system substrate-binding protein